MKINNSNIIEEYPKEFTYDQINYYHNLCQIGYDKEDIIKALSGNQFNNLVEVIDYIYILKKEEPAKEEPTKEGATRTDARVRDLTEKPTKEPAKEELKEPAKEELKEPKDEPSKEEPLKEEPKEPSKEESNEDEQNINILYDTKKNDLEKSILNRIQLGKRYKRLRQEGYEIPEIMKVLVNNQLTEYDDIVKMIKKNRRLEKIKNKKSMDLLDSESESESYEYEYDTDSDSDSEEKKPSRTTVIKEVTKKEEPKEEERERTTEIKEEKKSDEQVLVEMGYDKDTINVLYMTYKNLTLDQAIDKLEKDREYYESMEKKNKKPEPLMNFYSFPNNKSDVKNSSKTDKMKEELMMMGYKKEDIDICFKSNYVDDVIDAIDYLEKNEKNKKLTESKKEDKKEDKKEEKKKTSVISNKSNKLENSTSTLGNTLDMISEREQYYMKNKKPDDSNKIEMSINQINKSTNQENSKMGANPLDDLFGESQKKSENSKTIEIVNIPVITKITYPDVETSKNVETPKKIMYPDLDF